MTSARARVAASRHAPGATATPTTSTGTGRTSRARSRSRRTTRNALTGLAYGASIIPVKVLNRFGDGDEDAIAAGIRYAADRGAHIINLSFEFGSTDVRGAPDPADRRRGALRAPPGRADRRRRRQHVLRRGRLSGGVARDRLGRRRDRAFAAWPSTPTRAQGSISSRPAAARTRRCSAASPAACRRGRTGARSCSSRSRARTSGSATRPATRARRWRPRTCRRPQR